jgi:dipeptidyl aminopeptidase/acylaminoacyl peptidase
VSELPIGHRIGAYEVRSLLGRGGMGEVYRAHDSRLRRDVAIKILPPSFAADPERLARFEREARVLATLTHPNVAAIYGVEDNALVLELVEGETLAERLQRGVIPRNEIIAIARQIAEGLEAAHEAGIVHRDLKPANIKITDTGLVKLLDFGIAKVSVAHDDETRAATEDGRVIGTTAYMSPEQARGQQVDKRTDIWSYGCVLYEMLTRKHAFAKATPTDTLAAIIEHDPDWSAVPSSTPPAVTALLRRCLIKDTRERLRDIGEARIALKDGRADDTVPVRRRTPIVAAIATAAIAAAIAGVYLWSQRSSAPVATISFPINPPSAMYFRSEVMRGFFDLSPDGSRIAFVAGEGGTGQIWVQTIGELQARQVPNTERGGAPTWSPDGQALAFFQGGRLKRVDLPSGIVTAISEVPDFERQSASWGRDGQIAFASGEAGAIWVVPATGGTPEVVVKRDQAAGQMRVHFPLFLPDGKRFLYAIKMRDGSSRLAIAAKGTPPREIGTIESNMRWIEPDYLVSARGGALVAQRFDVDREQLVGNPVVVTERVNHFPTTSRALFSASLNGAISYHNATDQSQLTWFDRSGRITGTLSDLNDHLSARVSPDGTRVLFDKRGPGTESWDLWIADLGRNVETRVTSDPGAEVTPVWLSDGRGIIYGSDRGGLPPQLYRRDLDTGAETVLRPGVVQQQSIGVSPDGQTLGFVERGPAGNFELFLMPLARPKEAVQIGPPTRVLNIGSWFSPDNRALAFSSFRSGRSEVYVAPLATPTAAVTVSAEGGYAPRWSPDGQEVTFLSIDQKLMAAPVRTSPSLVVGKAVPLFSLSSGQWMHYDTAPDGRFLAVVMKQPADTQPIITIVNWRPPGS